MTRPSFQDAKKYFNNVKGLPARAASVIGGNVQTNIDNGAFENACAIRLSYVLNKSNIIIPSMPPKETDSGLWETVSGEEKVNGKKLQFIFRVTTLRNFLTEEFGPADEIIQSPSLSDLIGKKGIAVFGINFSDATGHATLIENGDCADECYWDRHPHTLHYWKLQ